MDKLDMYTQEVMEVIKGLKCECEKYDYCPTTCKFRNKITGSCYLHVNPCYYDLQAIENAIREILKSEMR